ncbi:MAG: aldo/keto reductase [Myxococcales bacterium]|nr:aldo/keto reductase [Myxococcales bacterium]
MRYRTFGRTGLAMPVFSCGGMRFQESWVANTPVGKKSQANLLSTLQRAFALGITHFETARGYGTSEAQVGAALQSLPRDEIILQTKVAPRADPAEFERHLEESFARLGVARIDLFAFHGLNDTKTVEWTLRPGGCHEVAERFRAQGRIGHIGFSTHASCRVITQAIESGRFDYVNLHWYFIFQENEPALAAAAAQDMGVFIISPSDKGGHLHTPRPLWQTLCAPLAPMQFNDLFCLSDPRVHTLSIGASKPQDFDAHVAVLPHLDDAAKVVAPVVARLQDQWVRALGDAFGGDYLAGVPEWEELPGGVNVRKIVWLFGLVKAFDLLPYARSRYNMLGKDDPWFPGNKAVGCDAPALRAALSAAPLADTLLGILPEAHRLLDNQS